MANRTEDKKPLTVKLYKPTHAKLKIYATLNEKSLDEVITEMITEVTDINIVKFVEEGLNKLEEESKDEYIDEFEADYQEYAEELEDQARRLGITGVVLVHPKKKVNLQISTETHKKLKIISSLYDESLESIASNIVENNVNDLDIVNLVSEEFSNDNKDNDDAEE